jgi:hypothetical protein
MPFIVFDKKRPFSFQMLLICVTEGSLASRSCESRHMHGTSTVVERQHCDPLGKLVLLRVPASYMIVGRARDEAFSAKRWFSSMKMPNRALHSRLDTWWKFDWETLEHVPYVPELAPSDFYKFTALKEHFSGFFFSLALKALNVLPPRGWRKGTCVLCVPDKHTYEPLWRVGQPSKGLRNVPYLWHLHCSLSVFSTENLLWFKDHVN